MLSLNYIDLGPVKKLTDFVYFETMITQLSFILSNRYKFSWNFSHLFKRSMFSIGLMQNKILTVSLWLFTLESLLLKLSYFYECIFADILLSFLFASCLPKQWNIWCKKKIIWCPQWNHHDNNLCLPYHQGFQDLTLLYLEGLTRNAHCYQLFSYSLKFVINMVFRVQGTPLCCKQNCVNSQNSQMLGTVHAKWIHWWRISYTGPCPIQVSGMSWPSSWSDPHCCLLHQRTCADESAIFWQRIPAIIMSRTGNRCQQEEPKEVLQLPKRVSTTKTERGSSFVAEAVSTPSLNAVRIAYRYVLSDPRGDQGVVVQLTISLCIRWEMTWDCWMMVNVEVVVSWLSC